MADLPLSIRLARPEELSHAVAIDESTTSMFTGAGLALADLDEQHPFVRAERARWAASLARSELWFAVLGEQRVGFVALGEVDGHAYLDQLTVAPEHGRRGIGRALLAHAYAVSRARSAPDLDLTTYDHIAWNRPFYERAGFRVLAESAQGPELRAILAEQRAALPAPERRIAMRRPLGKWM
jgi:ribosomal protein S18 acetylase RimI-like enzyme